MILILAILLIIIIICAIMFTNMKDPPDIYCKCNIVTPDNTPPPKWNTINKNYKIWQTCNFKDLKKIIKQYHIDLDNYPKLRCIYYSMKKHSLYDCTRSIFPDNKFPINNICVRIWKYDTHGPLIFEYTPCETTNIINLIILEKSDKYLNNIEKFIEWWRSV